MRPLRSNTRKRTQLLHGKEIPITTNMGKGGSKGVNVAPKGETAIA
jgi:hypothetical protein